MRPSILKLVAPALASSFARGKTQLSFKLKGAKVQGVFSVRVYCLLQG